MWEGLIRILTAVTIWELLLILTARIVEVSIGTLRVILMSKGYRLISAILAFVEILIWVMVASRVIVNIAETPIKVVVYALGFALGVFFGSILEGKVALGNVLIQAILPEIKGLELVNMLRDEGLAVTTIKAEGKESGKIVLMIYSRRKQRAEIVSMITGYEESAVIVSNDLASIHGGYISPTRKLLK